MINIDALNIGASKCIKQLLTDLRGEIDHNTIIVGNFNTPLYFNMIKDLYIHCLQETHFRPRDTYQLKVRGWKKIFHANGNQKKAGVAVLISDKIDFKIKTVT